MIEIPGLGIVEGRGNVSAKCPQCTGRSGKKTLRVNPDKGVWKCWRCGWTGGNSTHNTTNQPRPIDWEQRRQKCRELWAPATGIQGTLAETYLAGRGLRGIYPDETRFHPAVEYWEDGELWGTYPAMLNLFRNAQGKPVSIQRTYLSREGGKANLPTIKKIMPPCIENGLSGSAVRLFKPSSEIFIAEGIETALSIYAAAKRPVWATTTAGLMEKVWIPGGIREVVIAADNDESMAGETSANILADRLIRRGLKVKIMMPDEVGKDWNDILQGKA